MDDEPLSDDLKDELAAGREFALNLVRHLDAMGASSCTLLVTHEGVEYEVIVQEKKVEGP